MLTNQMQLRPGPDCVEGLLPSTRGESWWARSASAFFKSGSLSFLPSAWESEARVSQAFRKYAFAKVREIGARYMQLRERAKRESASREALPRKRLTSGLTFSQVVSQWNSEDQSSSAVVTRLFSASGVCERSSDLVRRGPRAGVPCVRVDHVS